MAGIGVGLIGVGRHGERYAQHLQHDCPELRFVGLARRDREAAARQAEAHGCRAFDSADALLADPEIEAVVIVVPPNRHRELVLAAAERGKAILLEKPAALGLEDGRVMLDAVRRAGVPVMMGQTLRYNGVVQTLRRERARVGAIHGIRISQRFEPSPLAWVDDPRIAGGGILLHTGVHSFDLVRYLGGMEATRVFCETRRTGAVRLENNFAAVFSLGEDGALATVAGSRATASRTGAMELAGDRGQLVADHVANRVWFVEGRTWTELPVPGDVPTIRETLRDFVKGLTTGAAMAIPLVEGIRAVAMAEACYRSATAGTPVAVESVDDAGPVAGPGEDA